jgi:peptidoglycan/xylan/chitin deacetylase (PgdA/CDA1 family)
MNSGAHGKPLASLSLDLDNQWAYMKTNGEAGWESFPSYLDLVVPRLLGLLDRHGLRITFFVVGQDAALEKNRAALRAIAAAGHEIANHSFHHEPWLHLYAPERIEQEIAEAEAAIESATGVRPRGFRGPGFSLSRNVLETLQRRGYRYDASTFPTFIGPLARAYFMLNAKLTAAEKAKRKSLYGTLGDGFRPLTPYAWTLDNGELIELPVTTFPGVRAPFHLTYVMFLARTSPAVARRYFRSALATCRLAAVAPSVLLHPLDALGIDDVPDLSFFPGMTLPSETKIALLEDALAALSRQFEVVTMSTWAERASQRRLRRRAHRDAAQVTAPAGHAATSTRAR